MRAGFIVIVAAVVPLLLPAMSAEARADRPNIVFVYTDDHGPWAVGVEHPQAHTPHMDRLLTEEGARLVNAFVTTPVCSPSRATLLTGRYATELAIHDWIHPSEDEIGLDPHMPTWSRILSDAGYTTALVGKWHVGHADRFHPTRFGFDEFVGFRQGGRPPADPQLEKHGEERRFQGLTVDILADHVIDFIQRHRDGPFLVAWHTRAPHRRWRPVADEDWAPYADIDPADVHIPNPDYPGLDVDRVRRETLEYLASVTGVDRNLGRVLATLDELGIADDTIVIFTANEGYNLGHNGFWGKGNGVSMLDPQPPDTRNIPGSRRPNLLDNSLRVPTAVRWPGVIPGGRVVEQTVTNLDWFPTLLAMANVDLAELDTLAPRQRGRNFLPLLKGESIEDWDNDLYAEYSPHHGIRAHMRALRTPHWKLVRDFLNPWRDELYDLRRDPQQRHNLIHDARFEVRLAKQALHEKIIAKMKKLDDPTLHLLHETNPTPNP